VIGFVLVTRRARSRADVARSIVQFRSLQFALLLVIFTAIPCGPARADIFRCVAPDGKTLYSDAPCPRGAVRSSNITSAVDACSTAECIAQREQAAEYAREQLRSEQELLASRIEKRQSDELEAAREQARLDELAWRRSPPAPADESTYAGGYPIYYPYYPTYPVYTTIRACGWRCAGLRRARAHSGASSKRSRGTALRLDRR
jgi:hypothetical protein